MTNKSINKIIKDFPQHVETEFSFLISSGYSYSYIEDEYGYICKIKKSDELYLRLRLDARDERIYADAVHELEHENKIISFFDIFDTCDVEYEKESIIMKDLEYRQPVKNMSNLLKKCKSTLYDLMTEN